MTVESCTSVCRKSLNILQFDLADRDDRKNPADKDVLTHTCHLVDGAFNFPDVHIVITYTGQPAVSVYTNHDLSNESVASFVSTPVCTTKC